MLKLPSHISSIEAEAINRFHVRVKKKFGKRLIKMKIFGSRARMEGSELSDIDILVIVDKLKSPKDKRAIFTIAAEIYGENEIDISPLVMSPQEFEEMRRRERRLALDIIKEGIALE